MSTVLLFLNLCAVLGVLFFGAFGALSLRYFNKLYALDRDHPSLGGAALISLLSLGAAVVPALWLVAAVYTGNTGLTP